VSFFGRCTRSEAADQSPRGKRANRPIKRPVGPESGLSRIGTTCDLRKENAADRPAFPAHPVPDAGEMELVARYAPTGWSTGPEGAFARTAATRVLRVQRARHDTGKRTDYRQHG